jgi:hypothetical protein
MRIRRSAVIVAIVASAFTASACGTPNPPCEQLPPPSQAEQQASREGAEVEREVEGDYAEAECVVVGDRWVDQTDDA